jgi:hypothetical protein
MSRQLISRANQVFLGRALIGNYQTGKPGGEVHLLYRFKPVGNRAVTFTAVLAAGATSATLNANWGGATGIWPITFSDGEVLNGVFTNGATTCTFLPASFPQVGGTYGVTSGLVNAVTASAAVGNQPPVLGVANTIGLSQSIAAGTPGLINGGSAVGGIAVLDVPRNVVAAWTGTAILTVTGTDMYGYPQTEASASGTSFTGNKAFATITAINVSASVTVATVGTGAKLGLPFKVESGDIFGYQFGDAADVSTFVAGDQTSPATSSTKDVRGTVSAAGALNGSSFYSCLIKPYDASTQTGLFGVTPA